MAMNLRLRPEAAAALRAEAERTGRSQQDVLREAVDRLLGLVPPPEAKAGERDPLLVAGTVRQPRQPYRKVRPTTQLPSGVGSLDLLDRDDRL